MRKQILTGLLIMILLSNFGCSNKLLIKLNKEPQQQEELSKHKKISRDEVTKIIMNQRQIKALKDKGIAFEVIDMTAPTEKKHFWRMAVVDKDMRKIYDYFIHVFTGKVVEVHVEENAEKDMERLRREMTNNVIWVFKNWQSFDNNYYRPTKYGLAFAINFRIPYIYDNYNENVKIVTEKEICSNVEIVKVKHSGVVYSEEDHTLYAQVRLIVRYHQKIEGQKYTEPAEVLIFSKNHLDADEGWKITNVDMYPTPESSENFNKLFFGFSK